MKVFPGAARWYQKIILAVFHKNFPHPAQPREILRAHFPMFGTFSAFYNRKELPCGGDVTHEATKLSGHYAPVYAEFSTWSGENPKGRNTCWKLRVFHILHRVLHKTFPQGWKEAVYKIGLHNSFRQERTQTPFFRTQWKSQQRRRLCKNYPLDKTCHWFVTIGQRSVSLL